ncbi:aryldialkylphosphatase [Rhizobium sp. NXC24]|uniref:phosphotriesterase family protein n=1 Tax=Rhizobium sp. NXC24 TaxID=2048897 RepID=UPI000CF2EE72|nr:aryldialkylphosphatase [Rhizobium sp. NXC24]
MRLTREQLRGRAQTVTGLVDPIELGRTLMHEHLIWDARPRDWKAAEPGPEIELCNCFKINYTRLKVPRNFVCRSADIVSQEVQEMIAAGGRTVVELSCGGLAPDPDGLIQIAKRTGAQIVMGCGYYLGSFQDQTNEYRSVESFAKEITSQILEGAWGTEARAGIIGEIGCQVPWTQLERRVLQGAIIAQAETGISVNIHPGRQEDQPQEIAEFVVANGGCIERTILSHIDRTIFDVDRLLRLADTGCVIEFDLFGQEQGYYPWSNIEPPNDAGRLRLIRALISHGHLNRVVISHDICQLTRLTRYGGHGYGHIYENVVPLMKERGFSESEIDAILVDNPKRLLTFV